MMADATSNNIDGASKCHLGFDFDEDTIKREPELIIEDVLENKDGITDFLEQKDSNVNLYDCVICDERIYSTESLLVHLKEHARKNEKKPSKTDPLQRTLKELLRDYVKIKVDLSGNPIYTCKLCPSKTFEKNMSITEHMRTHEHPTYQALKCVFCGEVFSTMDDFLVHIATHKEYETIKSFRCERSLLIAQRKTLKPIAYAKCDRKIYRKSTVGAHMKEKIYKCSFCEKTFSCEYTVKYHIEYVHEKKSPYSCKTCNKVIKHRSSYRKHLQGHLLEVSNKCGICSFQTKSSFSLKKHMKTHTVKQYNCSLCDKTYQHMTSFNYHLRTHSGEKPYKCTKCNKSFTSKTQLTRHSYVHTETRPYYECSDCGKRYAQKKNLEFHQKKYTLGRHTSSEYDNSIEESKLKLL